MDNSTSQTQLLHRTKVTLGQGGLDGSVLILKDERMQIRFSRKRKGILSVKGEIRKDRDCKYFGAGENTLHITKKR